MKGEIIWQGSLQGHFGHCLPTPLTSEILGFAIGAFNCDQCDHIWKLFLAFGHFNSGKNRPSVSLFLR